MPAGDVGRMLAVLDSPPRPAGELATKAELQLVSILQALLDLLDSARERLAHVPNFHVQYALLYSALDEFVAALHLARYRYYIQAHAHLRAVLEIANLLQVFDADSALLKVWASENWREREKHLSPKTVRKKLGLGWDSLYGYLCDVGSHPTFRAFQSRVYWRRPAGSDSPFSLVVRYAGTDAPELEQFFYCAVTVQVLERLLEAVNIYADRAGWDEEVVDLMEALLNSGNAWNRDHFIPWAEKHGLDASKFRAFLADIARAREEPEGDQ
jgi:hypothetical protein